MKTIESGRKRKGETKVAKRDLFLGKEVQKNGGAKIDEVINNGLRKKSKKSWGGGKEKVGTSSSEERYDHKGKRTQSRK